MSDSNDPVQHASGSSTVGFGQLLQAGIRGGVIAAVLCVLALLVGNAMIDGVVQVTPPGSSVLEDLSVWLVIAATVFPGVAGAIVLYGMLRLRPAAGGRIFAAAAFLITVASCVSPLGLDISGAAQVILIVMHLVAGAAITVALMRATTS
jgi:hypothetical protein